MVLLFNLAFLLARLLNLVHGGMHIVGACT